MNISGKFLYEYNFWNILQLYPIHLPNVSRIEQYEVHFATEAYLYVHQYKYSDRLQYAFRETTHIYLCDAEQNVSRR